MAILNYDWISSLTEIQKNYIYKQYRQLWDYYTTYGYELLAIHFERQVLEMYDVVKSVKLVEPVALPKDVADAVREMSCKLQEVGNLKQVIVAVPNYHIAFISEDLELCKVLQRSLNDVPIVLRNALTEDVLRSDCTAVILDDVEMSFTEDDYKSLELHCIPYIRRSVLQWFDRTLSYDVENVLKHFVTRNRPCKYIR